MDDADFVLTAVRVLLYGLGSKSLARYVHFALMTRIRFYTALSVSFIWSWILRAIYVRLLTHTRRSLLAMMTRSTGNAADKAATKGMPVVEALLPWMTEGMMS